MATPSTFEDLQTEVDTLVGTRLTPAERDRFINEGHIELCVRSGWTNATRDLGPTVAGQELYTLPSDARKPLSVTVGGKPFTNTDQRQVRRLKLSRTLILASDGVWYVAHSSAGARQLGIYPASSGATLEVELIYTPALMTAPGDEPVVPGDFRPAIVDYVVGYALSRAEEAIEDRSFYQAEFDRQVDRLASLAKEFEAGDESFVIPVAGWTS